MLKHGFQMKIKQENMRVTAYNSGHKLSAYEFPNVDIPFHSNMVRWENLAFCGGYFIEDMSNKKELVQSLIDGTKPIGFLVEWEENEIQKHIEKVKHYETSLSYTVNEINYFGRTSYELAICQDVITGDEFNMKDLIESYKLMGIELSSDEVNRLLSFEDTYLSNFLSDWDYANPSNVVDCIICGLFLGYPVQSTVAFINGDIY